MRLICQKWTRITRIESIRIETKNHPPSLILLILVIFASWRNNRPTDGVVSRLICICTTNKAILRGWDCSEKHPSSGVPLFNTSRNEWNAQTYGSFLYLDAIGEKRLEWVFVRRWQTRPTNQGLLSQFDREFDCPSEHSRTMILCVASLSK